MGALDAALQQIEDVAADGDLAATPIAALPVIPLEDAGEPAQGSCASPRPRDDLPAGRTHYGVLDTAAPAALAIRIADGELAPPTDAAARYREIVGPPEPDRRPDTRGERASAPGPPRAPPDRPREHRSARPHAPLDRPARPLHRSPPRA